MSMSFPDPKDPEEVLDYVIDWTDTLVTGETISTSTWAISPSTGTAPLAEDSSDLTGTNLKTRIWLSAGDDGVIYTLTNTITTSDSRTYERTVRLRVRDGI